MAIETVRLSQQGKDQLVKLKRLTGVKQWNYLCRWALTASLSDPSLPLVRDVVTDSNVEMTWKTFAGDNGDVYAALVAQRAALEGRDEYAVFTSHLHRGIGELAGQAPKGIEELVAISVS